MLGADQELDGTTLRVYVALVNQDKPVGPRELTRLANLSSPSVAYRQLQKLEELGLVEKTPYGDYTVKVHYYADHDADTETVQPISWNLDWRFLAFCPDPCANPEETGIWEEGSSSGFLSSASSGNCCNIGHAGADWSDAVSISYPQPDPADWTVPAPPAVMLP